MKTDRSLGEKQKFIPWENAGDNLEKLEPWEQEFHARFGGTWLYPYDTPDGIREFINKVIAKEKIAMLEEIAKHAETKVIHRKRLKTTNPLAYILRDKAYNTRKQVAHEIRQKIAALQGSVEGGKDV